MPIDSSTVAAELTEWFRGVQRVTDKTLFGIAPDGPHREAVVLDALRRYARTLYDSIDLDSEGRLYSPLCFFLAAACQQLRIELGPGHWQAALEDVREQRKRLSHSESQSAAFGLNIEAPAALLKLEFNEAIRQSGLLDGATFLSREDREVAIGLATNWALRLLIAYALDVSCPPSSPTRKNLSWLAELVRSAISE
jgi:hypothetical protein